MLDHLVAALQASHLRFGPNEIEETFARLQLSEVDETLIRKIAAMMIRHQLDNM